MIEYAANCPICLKTQQFQCTDDYFSSRDGLVAQNCPYGNCVTRERALAYTVRNFYSERDLLRLKIHESSPANRGLAMWFANSCPRYIQTGFFPEHPLGSMIGKLRNENLECQTFADELFDLVIHLDVLEHLFEPFQALREIRRTLVMGGKCIFSVPTECDRFDSVRLASKDCDGNIKTIGIPEYHANPQDSQGSLVTWRYGYNLPLLIARETGFDVEVRRIQSNRIAVNGQMTEIYILSK